MNTPEQWEQKVRELPCSCNLHDSCLPLRNEIIDLIRPLLAKERIEAVEKAFEAVREEKRDTPASTANYYVDSGFDEAIDSIESKKREYLESLENPNK